MNVQRLRSVDWCALTNSVYLLPHKRKSKRHNSRGSGSQSWLPTASPLRTVLAPFGAHAQASTKPHLSIRFHKEYTIFFSIQLLPMALEMIYFKISCSIRATIGSFQHMSYHPRATIFDGFLPVGTHAILPLPDSIKLYTPPSRCHYFLAPSGFKIRLPVAGVRGRQRPTCTIIP